MTTEISAWECELKTKENESPECPSAVLETGQKKEEQKRTDTATSTTTAVTTASATNTPKKQKLVHFNKN